MIVLVIVLILNLYGYYGLIMNPITDIVGNLLDIEIDQFF